MGEVFYKTKVLSRNMITDWIQSYRNMFGLPLTAYENIIKEAQDEMAKEYLIGKKIKWFRMDVDQGNDESFIITLCGEYK